jgi:uncharacterized protein YcbK (DUF882 family)
VRHQTNHRHLPLSDDRHRFGFGQRTSGAGSFVTEDLERRANDPENRILLQARVTPVELASQVRWVIEDLPGDVIVTIPPGSAPVGAVTSFLVPIANQNRGHWPADHAASLALRTKRLAYKVTATVVSGGKTYSSAPDSVKQDSLDVLRQEYIDWQKVGRRSVTRRTLSDVGDAHRNSGDYVIWPSSDRLATGMAALQGLAMTTFHKALTVTGGFRNPVHHHLHGGGGRHPVAESTHLYGEATDFRISDPPDGMSASRYFREIRELAWDTTVGGCFEPSAVIVAGAGSLDHAHVDWRVPCPTNWGATQ